MICFDNFVVALTTSAMNGYVFFSSMIEQKIQRNSHIKLKTNEYSRAIFSSIFLWSSSHSYFTLKFDERMNRKTKKRAITKQHRKKASSQCVFIQNSMKMHLNVFCLNLKRAHTIAALGLRRSFRRRKYYFVFFFFFCSSELFVCFFGCVFTSAFAAAFSLYWTFGWVDRFLPTVFFLSLVAETELKIVFPTIEFCTDFGVLSISIIQPIGNNKKTLLH